MPEPVYLDAWRERFRAESRERDRRRERARALAGELAAILKEHYGATCVWLIGSLARGDFDLDSDIDLVAEGIAPEKFFRACATVDRCAEDIEIDLAPREDLRPRAAAALEREGVLL